MNIAKFSSSTMGKISRSSGYILKLKKRERENNTASRALPNMHKYALITT
jgi:hypothetical protein